MAISNGQNRDTPVSPFCPMKVTVVLTILILHYLLKEVTICEIFGGVEGHEILKKKNMKTPSMYWGITIFSNFDVRVGEKRQFLSGSKKHEF